MEKSLSNCPYELSLEQLMQTSVGAKIQQAIEIIHNIQNHYFAIIEKQDELDVLGIRTATVMVFAVLRKIAEGKRPCSFDSDDWKDITVSISKNAILPDDGQYAVYIFDLYERYIRFSANTIKVVVSPKVVDSVNALADELHCKAEELKRGEISEVMYTEGCFWICLEAMIKLLASTTFLMQDKRISEFSQALASLAFEYGGLMLYSREQEIVNQFIESQHQMDDELERKYAGFLEELNKQSEQFYSLIENAFAPNFRDAFLKSVILANVAGVKQDEILSSRDDIDCFFLD